MPTIVILQRRPPKPTLGGISGEQIRIDTEAIEGLKTEGRKVGIDVDAKFPGLGTWDRTTSFQNESDLQTEFGKASGQIEAAKKSKQGGGPQPPDGPVGNGGGGVDPGRR